MKRRILKNENLDRLGREIVGAASKRKSEEIKKILNSPTLFQSVRKRIESDRRIRGSKNASFSRRNNFYLLSWQQLAAISVILLFFIFSAIVFYNLERSQIVQIGAPEISSPAKPLEIPPPEARAEEKQSEFVKADFRESIKRRPQIFTGERVKARNAQINPVSQRKSKSKQTLPPVEFYALGSASNTVQPGEELKVVRTELSRAELFALGVNLSIENGPEKIKTDMLVGRDGVARAFRIVE